MATILVVAMLAPAAIAQTIADPPLTGQEVMEEQHHRHHARQEFVELRMTLVDRHGGRQPRQLQRWDQETEAGLDRTLMVFLKPEEVKGTALLSWENVDQPDDQWLYLPSQKRLQRIAPGSRRGYFTGTDFTYEDLEPETLADYRYERLTDQVVAGQPCFVIDAFPADEARARSSGYQKRRIWVRTDQFSTARVEFFDRHGRHIKTQTNGQWVNLRDQLWRARHVEMHQLANDHRTVIEVDRFEIDREIPAALFEPRYLIRERHLR
ncbi:outer membrane lipoprotein-sorting protein [bacterium]|nr:outer membrane lipoprotein-sorting protein [bacterium]